MSRRRTMGFLACFPLFCGCGGGEADSTGTTPVASAMPTSTGTMMMPMPMPTTATTLGGTRFSLIVDAAVGTLTLKRGDKILLVLPADALQLGQVTAVTDSALYDPYPIVAMSKGFHAPAGLQWIAPSGAKLSASTTSTAQLSLTYPGGMTATLDVEAAQDGRFKLTLTPKGDNLAFLRIRARADKTEGFYGLGEYYDHVEHRGRIRAMQLELDAKTESGDNEAHVPIPFLIGTNAWGLFVENPFPGVFDVATTEADLVEATFGTGLHTTDGIVFHLFASEVPLDVTHHYHAVTGKPNLPARWALGPWLWRDENKDQAQVESDVAKMRDLDLAHTALWIDRPYATGVQTFDFLNSQFPDPAKMIATAHDLGFRMGVWHAPYIDQKDPNTAANFAEVQSKGFLAPTQGIAVNKWGPLFDLTNPDAYAWWQDHVRQYTNAGIEGFKLDYGEDVVPGAVGARDVWKFYDGSDERTMHSRFPLFYHKVYAETLPASGGFLLCRHGAYGDQVNISVVWPGDLDATFAQHGEVAPDVGNTTYVSVGGLPASIIAGMSLGPSGFPFYGADTGGYRHSPPDKELFTRWFEQTALSTVMQIGNSSSTVAWEADPVTGYDDEMLGWYRTYTRLHLRLFAYEWSYAQRLLDDGRPIVRPLGLAYPELGVHPDDEYMFGDYLLVAPVLARGQTTRTVLFPPGVWVDYWTGESHQGGASETVDAPLGKLPLFVAQGGIVPLLRPTIDAMAPTTHPDTVDSYATTPGLVWPRIVPGKVTIFPLFDGGSIKQEKQDDGVHLTLESGSELSLGAMLEVMTMGAMPSSVTESGNGLTQATSLADLEAMDAGFFFDGANGGSVFVKVPGGHREVLIAP